MAVPEKAEYEVGFMKWVVQLCRMGKLLGCRVHFFATEDTLRHLRAVVEKDSYPVLPIFKLLQKTGNIAEKMMYNTFNMGLGMVLAIDPADKDKVLSAIEAAGEKGYVVGKVIAGEKGVDLC